MKEVTKDQFYAFIGTKDVVGSIVTDFPYTMEYSMRGSRNIIAKAVDSLVNGIYPIVTTYFTI